MVDNRLLQSLKVLERNDTLEGQTNVYPHMYYYLKRAIAIRVKEIL